MAKIVIIGAGLTGISAAYHLEQRGFFDYELYEKEETVGGLCRSVEQDGFTFDYTGHLLHASDDYFRSLIHDLIGIENLNSIHRRSFIYSHATYTRYPYQINLFGLPENVIIECISGYINRQKARKKTPNFLEYVNEHFGKGLAQHFFSPFQSKILAYDLKDVTSSWMGRFVPKTSLEEMLAGALQDKGDAPVGYNSHFYYPKRGGIYYWIEKFAQSVQLPVYTNHTVREIDVKNKQIYFTNGNMTTYETLITTMPLDNLLNTVKESSSNNLKSAISKLACNSVVNFNVGVSRPDLSERHWIYYPEKQFPFYRIGFPHNFSQFMAPEGCSSLYGEFAYINKSNHYVQQKLEASLAQVKKLFSISKNEIATEKIIYIPRAYVIYNFWRERNLPKLLTRLAESDIHSVGRYGAWKYSSMQEAVLDGRDIVEQLTIVPARQTYYQEIVPQSQPYKERELQ